MSTQLEQLVEKFSAGMLAKLNQQKDRGWTGWRNRQRFPDHVIVERLLSHVGKALHDPKQWIDVANFAAFLWWRSRKDK